MAGNGRGRPTGRGGPYDVSSSDDTPRRCSKCRRPAAKLVDTKAGPCCKRCADHLPPHVRRVKQRKSPNIARGVAKNVGPVRAKRGRR